MVESKAKPKAVKKRGNFPELFFSSLKIDRGATIFKSFPFSRFGKEGFLVFLFFF
jgi:hypothetical protein